MKKFLLTISLLFVLIYSQAQLNNELLIYYPFDDNTVDYSGNDFNGKEFGVKYVPDRYSVPNSACAFDGLNDYIEFPNLLELKPELPVTFSFWVKYNSTSFGQRIIFNTSLESDRSAGVSFVYQGSTDKYALSYGDGSYYFAPYTRRTFISNATIDTTEWHNIIAIVEGPSNMKIIIDCENVGGDYFGTGGDLVYSDHPGVIGRHDANTDVEDLFFKGILDEFRYWGRALNNSEIDTICKSEFKDPEEPTIQGLLIYPNPSEIEVFFKSDIEDLSRIKIYDFAGQRIFEGGYTSQLNIGFLATGVYIFEVSDDNYTNVFRKKVIVRRLHRFYRLPK